MNRIDSLFNQKKQSVLNVYFTAGYPQLNSMADVLSSLQDNGADIIEIGMPYSDPLADGPVIQQSNMIALDNGMSIPVLFDQLKNIRTTIHLPIILMGYMNPILQFGLKNFCEAAAAVGVDGVIIPDLPMVEYEEFYKDYFIDNAISNIFLVTPQTSEERIRKIDDLSNGFIYLLSSSSTTGKNLTVSNEADAYFSRIREMNLKNPTMIGFGISDQKSFNKAAEYTRGAIVGSAFVKFLDTENALQRIPEFINSIRP